MSQPIKPSFVLIAHDPTGRALLATAHHILGYVPKMIVADVVDTDLPEPWVEKLVSDIRQDHPHEVLIFCDLYGSTPYHIATAVQRQLGLKGKDVHVLSGVNVVMLVKAITDHSDTLAGKIEQILFATRRGIVHQAPSSFTN